MRTSGPLRDAGRVLRDLRVCFVGDSFVAGVGDPEHLGWVGRVAARTHRTGQPLTAYVLGVRRQTSRDIAGRWRAECAARLPRECDGRVVISLGVNDTTVEDGVTRMAVNASAKYLDSMLDGVQKEGWSALVVGPPPVADPVQNERIAELEVGISTVCGPAEVSYIRVFDQLAADPVWMREVADGDGAHPGARGYQRLAELVWPHWHAWTATDEPPRRVIDPDG